MGWYMRILIIALIMLSITTPLFAEQDIISCIISVESSGNPSAYNSRSGAIGLMQITPIVLREYNEDTQKNCLTCYEDGFLDQPICYRKIDLYNPKVNRQVGSWYFNYRIPKMLKHYHIKDTIENRLWAYNSGIGNVVKGIKPKETRDYIRKVTQLYERQ